MTILYKHFMKLRIVLCFAYLILFIAPAMAADPLFTVANVAVDVTAENAIAARNQAFEEAQVKAFEELSARMLPDSELATFQAPDPLTISTMIQDYELINEKLSAVRYIGTYTFRFKDDAVRKYFSQSDVTYSDVSSGTLLVLPFFSAGNQTTLWSPYNVWMRAWKSIPEIGGVVPLQLPLGDLDDVRDISDEQALSYDPSKLSDMLERYGAGEAVIAIAVPDRTLAQMRNQNEKAQGQLNVEIYRTDRGQPEMVQQVALTANGSQTVQQLYTAAVYRVHNELQKDWKARTVVRSAQENRIQVAVPITSLGDWISIQKDLERVSGIREVVVKSITSRQAVVELLYRGDAQRLVLALQQAGMSLQQQTYANGDTQTVLSKGRYKPMRL